MVCCWLKKGCCFFSLASNKKRISVGLEGGNYKAFLVSPMGMGRKSDGRHKGFCVCLGGETHDTSSAWELDLLHQGDGHVASGDSCLAVGSWLDGRAVT